MTITDAELFLIYTGLWLVVILGLWLGEIRRSRRSDWELSKGRLFNCSHCHHQFIVKESFNVVRCPRCNAMCILRKNHL